MRGSLAKAAPALSLGVQRRCARLRDNRQRSVSGVTHRRLRRDATHAFHGRAVLLGEGGDAGSLANNGYGMLL
eukprot:scaffold24404_cov81-Isochrysis_galbana.AAC.2